MSYVSDFLRKTIVQYCATIGLDGKPQVRPFQFMLERDGRYFFCTSSAKRVFQELRRQPYMQLCALYGTEWIRFGGRAVFVDDHSIKAQMLSDNPAIKAIFKTPDNREFEIFYLADAQAIIADESGGAPKLFRI